MKPINQINQELRSAIVEAVPEIMELKFGCRVRLKSSTDDNVHIIIYSWETESGDRRYGIDGYVIADFKEKDFEILGRPITLSDVLRAMDNRRKENYTGMDNVNNQDYLLDIFDLEKDFDWQSDDVWRFLHSVICEK
jgi:hypothetical protein